MISGLWRRYLLGLVISILLGVLVEAIYLYVAKPYHITADILFILFIIVMLVLLATDIGFRYNKYKKKKDTKDWFKELKDINKKDVIKKFQYSYRTLYVIATLLVILILISHLQQIGLAVDYNLRQIGGIEFIRTVEYILVFLILVHLAIIAPTFMIKEFWFDFAKIYIKVVQNEEREVDKTAYLFLGLEMYDKYLRKTLNFRIRDLEKIFDKILCLRIEGKYALIASISNALGGEKLDLARQLSKRYLPELNTDQFLIKEKIGQKIKDASALIIPIITIAVTIIGLIIKK